MLRTLGNLELIDNAFGRAKPLTLLAYLVLEGPTTRRQLRTLFWNDSTEAGNSLRVTLSQLRTVLPDQIIVEGEQVRVELQCDAALMLQAVQEQRYADALSFYKGPFLPGWGQHGAELEEWWGQTRDYLASRAAQAALGLGEAAASTGNWAQGAAYAAQALGILTEVSSLPLLERAYRLLRAANDPAYELLLAPYDLPLPSLSPEQAQASLMSPLARSLSSSDLFVGRSSEMEWLLRYIPVSRLVTIHGLGGSGKTSLARAVFAHPGLRLHFHEMVWIAADHGTSDALIERVSEHLGLSAPVTSDTLAQRLAGRRVLIVLDGADDLGPQLASLHQFNQQFPLIHLLLTARSAQGLSREQTLLLRGFQLPEGPLGKTHPARQLLAQGAEQEDLQEGEEDQLDALCRLVSALPFALLQVGRLRRTLSSAQLRQALTHDLRALETDSSASGMTGMQEIWRSTAARLTVVERNGVQALSALHTPFGAELAEALSIPPALLARLHDLAFLEKCGDGQFRWVPLVAAYARYAQSPEQRAAAQAYAAHVILNAMNDRAELWADPVVRTWGVVHEQDIHAALRWGVEHSAPELSGALNSTLLFYETAAQYQPALNLYLDLLGLSGTSETQPALLAGAAWFASRLNLLDEAQQWAERALNLLPLDAWSVRMPLENTLGNVASLQQDAARAEVHFSRALDGAIHMGDISRQITYLGNLAATQPDAAASAVNYLRALSLCTRLGDEERRNPLIGGWAYIQLFRIERGDVEMAFELLNGQITRLTELMLPVPLYLHLYLACTALTLGHALQAQESATLAYQAARERRELAFEISALLMVGRAQAWQGLYTSGLQTLLHGLRQACAARHAEGITDALLFYAEAITRQQGGRAPLWLRTWHPTRLTPYQNRLFLDLLSQLSADALAPTPPLDVWLSLQLLIQLEVQPPVV
ncbi:NB-ARC domain-containing protein [Deinococcus gobiensis]|nr:NB-ARC domain-containing protein [Deinococcus gobiensis]